MSCEEIVFSRGVFSSSNKVLGYLDGYNLTRLYFLRYMKNEKSVKSVSESPNQKGNTTQKISHCLI